MEQAKRPRRTQPVIRFRLSLIPGVDTNGLAEIQGMTPTQTNARLRMLIEFGCLYEKLVARGNAFIVQVSAPSVKGSVPAAANEHCGASGDPTTGLLFEVEDFAQIERSAEKLR